MGDDVVEYYHSLCRQPHVTRVEIVRTVDRLGERVSKVVSSTTEPPFSHVDVEAALRKVPFPVDVCLAMVGPWEQREPDGVFPIPGAILKVALLGCAPFIDLDPPTIRYVPKSDKSPPPGPQYYDCRNQDRLFDDLITPLYAFEMGYRSLEAKVRELLKRRSEAMAWLWDVLLLAAGLDVRHRGFDDTTMGLSPRKFVDKIQEDLEALSKIQAVDLQRGLGGTPQVWDLKRQLVVSMYDAFAANGPSLYGLRPFPYAAVHATLAAILNTLGVHNRDGNPFKAAGIKSLLRSRPTRLRTRG
jgi:hypothetical protein